MSAALTDIGLEQSDEMSTYATCETTVSDIKLSPKDCTDKDMLKLNNYDDNLGKTERSNNASSETVRQYPVPVITVDTSTLTEKTHGEVSDSKEGQVNIGFEIESNSEDGFVQLTRSKSDDLLEVKHQEMAREAAGQLGESPSAVSEVQGGNYDTEDNIGENCTPEYVLVGSSCTESPVTASEDDVGQEGDDYFIETSGDERMAIIEEEYIDRITMLEQRNYDLEIVLRRLTSAVERLLCLSEDDTSEINTDDVEGYDVIVDIKPQKEYDSPEEVVETDDVDKIEDAEDNFKADAQPEAKDASVDDAGEAADGSRKEGLVDSTAREVSRNICIELFIEFQKRLMMFAGELKGVLSCGESAIRHGRVVQEWGKSVQLMFEQLLHERRKMMNFIDEREQTLMLAREQFIGERQEQGTQLEHLLEDMKKYRDLVEETETVCRDRMLESSQRRAVAEGLADQLLQRRLDEERAIILGLSRQSKISEMKLFIMHQQNCIQDLQIQNRELRAVIEGLVGPDDLEVLEISD